VKRPTSKIGRAVLGPRALNRALLARQLLLERSTLPVPAAIEHLVGMQAQSQNAPYLGLWTRLEGFHQDDLARLIHDRSAVRIALMRSTIHLVTAHDCLALRPVVQASLERALYTGSQYGKRLVGMDIESLLTVGRALLEEKPRTNAALGELLSARWPDRDRAALVNALRNLLPLIQVPPRGIWGAGGQATSTTAESWLGRPLDTDPAPDVLLLRYLAAFGPASVNDMQIWSGLNRLREVVERLRPRLCTFEDEQGKELFDLPDAPRPDPDLPVSPRFLADFDNVLLGHEDRSRIIREDYRRRIGSSNGVMAATVLVDGFVRGSWKITREGESATLAIEAFEALRKPEVAALRAEGLRLLAFAAAESAKRDVRIDSPTK
jgi:winged helix DNA-binding protein